VCLALASCGSPTSPDLEALSDPGPVDARFDGALSFDGVDDYASVGTARMPQIEEPQSLMLMFRPEGKVPDGRDVQAMFTLRRGRQSGIVLALDDDVPLVYNVFGDRELARASAKVSLGEWHQLTFVILEESCTLYVDGALAGNSNGALFTNRTPIEAIIGAAGGYSRPFHGAIDELRVYSRAFGADEIAELAAGMAPADDERLVLYLPFDEASGARSYDRSSSANHAELGDGVPESMPTRIRAQR